MNLKKTLALSLAISCLSLPAPSLATEPAVSVVKSAVSVAESAVSVAKSAETKPRQEQAKFDKERGKPRPEQTKNDKERRETGKEQAIFDKEKGKTGKEQVKPASPFNIGKVKGGPLVEKYLITGKLADGEAALLQELAAHENNDQVRFGLGILQFLQAFEGLEQDLSRYGLKEAVTRGVRPLPRLPVPTNLEPEKISYEKLREVAERFSKKLAQAEASLAAIKDEKVKLSLHFGLIRLDLNGDGEASEEETLWKQYASLSRNTGVSSDKAAGFYISFDRGDVHWLRGYCHLIGAFPEMYLAHDSRELFERTAHLLFSRVESPYGFLAAGKQVHPLGESFDAADLIAAIHLINCPVVEPKRMETALHHFEAVVSESRVSWRYILAETDDDHEWLPNPNQTGVIPNVRVTKEMVQSWSEVMNEVEQLLAGKLLLPFWRGEEPVGINVRKVFLEPRTFDLVLWVQGTAAAPYLERGERTRKDTWTRLMRDFGGHFPGFAFWFN
ncbi:MAG TPA: hypothetical protein PLY72_19495 [Candidatus Obscuribacter sp.]|nr:hypothetical protein [Candidatus Obscuribacter sp.]